MEEGIQELHLSANRRVLLLFNLVLFLVHVTYQVWYVKEGMGILWGYNLFSITLFTINFYFAYREMAGTILVLDFLEIFIFMTLNTFYLGWSYGFQYYAFGLLVSVLLAGLYNGKNKAVLLSVKVYVALLILDFMFLRLWLYDHPPIYEEHHYARYMYLGNSLLVLLLIVFYTQVLIKTAYDLHDHLLYVASHDGLTGLLNRHSIEKKAEKDCPWYAILDVDHFKRINDTHGHAAGDEALRLIGRILVSYHDQMLCGRYGGEEFLLCGYALPENQGKEKAASEEQVQEQVKLELLEELRRQIERTSFSFDGKEIHLTVTIGVGDTIREADDRLYEGKRSGRNQVVAS